MPDILEQGILIVDDEESVLITLRRLLKSKGFSNISSALNAKQAIKFIENAKNPFSLIISDQKMPGMTGGEFLKKCVVLTPDSRRMLMTGYPDPSSIIDGINRGNIQKYIIKPWDNDDLLNRIMEELQIYERYQDKKNLHKTLLFQNSHFFKLAKKFDERDKKIQQEVGLKKDKIDSLNETLEKIKAEAKKGKKSIGLDGLLSRNIIINQDNLVQAFALMKKEVGSFLRKISKKNNISFSFEDIEQLTNNHKSGNKDQESIFEIIDLIIDQVNKNIEPSLYAMGGASIPKSGIDSYEIPSDIGELAYREGYITHKELDQVRIKSEGLDEEQVEIDIDKALLASGLITRIDLSRLVVKKEFIDIRLKDRAFAKELVEKDLASKRAIKQAFIKQLNIFEEEGGCVILGDILVEGNIITPELRDEMLVTHGGLEGYGKGIDSNLKILSKKVEASINLYVSDDKTAAYIKIPKSIQKSCDVSLIKDLLKKRGIKFGIIEDKLIKQFLKDATDPEKELIIAKGRPPVAGKDALIKYYFNAQQKSPGIVTEDGTINFRDRGDISFVKKGELLAEKIPLIKGKPGCNIFGKFIPADDVQDCSLKWNKGITLSKDNLKLFSTIEGRPTIDAQGKVCILKELSIKGDVNFETGNINFSGNVIVTGTVKAGFRVKCVDLTVNMIIGGIIETSGDLNVSTGIVDSQVRTQGNILAKFINNSKIMAFGNITVTREIMESEITINGECINAQGRITASTIAARKGFTLWQVGTEKSIASTIKTGVDEYNRKVLVSLDDELAKMHNDIDQIMRKKNSLEDRNFEMHKNIAEHSLVQERMQKKRDSFKKQLTALKDKKAEMLRTLKEIEEIELSIKNTDKEIKNIFKDQDKTIKAIETCEQRIKDANIQMEDLTHQKKFTLEVTESIPVIKVRNSIYEGTKIIGPETSMVVKQKLGPCKIMEIKSSDPDDSEGRQMVIQNIS